MISMLVHSGKAPTIVAPSASSSAHHSEHKIKDASSLTEAPLSYIKCAFDDQLTSSSTISISSPSQPVPNSQRLSAPLLVNGDARYDEYNRTADDLSEARSNANSTDDLVMDMSAAATFGTCSDARLLYRRWRTSPRGQAENLAGELADQGDCEAIAGTASCGKLSARVFQDAQDPLPRISERGVSLFPEDEDTADSSTQFGKSLNEKNMIGADEGIKCAEIGCTYMTKASSYQALSELEKQMYFPVAPKPSPRSMQRGSKDSLVNDMCRAVVKYMVGDIYVTTSGAFGSKKVLNHLYEPVFQSVQKHFRRLPARYALSVNPNDVPLHMRLLAKQQRNPLEVAVHVQARKNDDGNVVANECEAVMVSIDQDNLLDAITRALTSMMGSIIDADVMTTIDGVALDRFIIRGKFISTEKQNELRAQIQENLNRLSLEGDPEIQALTSSQQASSPRMLDPSAQQAMKGDDFKSEWKIEMSEISLQKAIGIGRSGHTYEAQWRGTRVAAKLIDCSVESEHVTQDILNEFKREVSIVSRLRHPNIILFLGAAISPPRYCLVFEFMANGTLWDLIRARTNQIDFFQIARDVAMGMNYLHLCAIIHRDLKSGNILLDSHGLVKISDFGLSCFLEIGSNSIDLTAETGTYRWMAPEVIRHEPYSSKADVYSYGIVLWEMITKDQPFRGMTPIQAAFSVARQQMRPALPRSMPVKLRDLVEHCWHQEPDRRPSFSDILDAIPYVKQSMKKRDCKSLGFVVH